MRPYLSSKPPEGMLCHVLLQWYDMAEHKVDPKQHLPAQLLQMLPYILLVWLWCLQSHRATLMLGKGKKGLQGELPEHCAQTVAWRLRLHYMMVISTCCSETGQAPHSEPMFMEFKLQQD